MRIALRVPDLQIDAVENAVHLGAPRIENPLKPHAELRARQLAGMGRAHRRDTVGVDQAGLEEAELAEVLEAVGVEPGLRQSQ